MVACWFSSLSVCLSSSSSCGSGCRPRSCHTTASLWCSRRYRLERSFTLTRRTTLLYRQTRDGNSKALNGSNIMCSSLYPVRMHPSPYPLLPVLEARLCSVPFCRSWLFMIASCLCFRSISLALTSSSIHTSEKAAAENIQTLETRLLLHLRQRFSNISLKVKGIVIYSIWGPKRLSGLT